ncbi:SsrA-binding protein SmpB [bacterium]|nr:SsrA-binding protein SmpB [bacterium]
MNHVLRRQIASNRRAFFDYEILEKIEAGIVLLGPEIKSIRSGHVSINEAYAYIDSGEVWLLNCNIREYDKIAHEHIEPTRTRKLLMHSRQISKWKGKTAEKGYTIVPLQLYFSKNIVKIELGLAKSKKLYDKRQSIKDREAKREADRASKNY